MRRNAKSPTKVELVYEELRQRILRGDFQSGERLAIHRIAEDMGMSDIPVREGMRLLAKDGLVEYTPYGGARIRGLSDVEICELFFVRSVLEASLTQLSVSFIPEITFRKLDALAEDLEGRTREQDAAGYTRLNAEFHRTIFSVVPSKYLIEVVESLYRANEWSRLTFLLDPSRMVRSNAEHREILSALSRRSLAGAGMAAFRHKQSARKSLLAVRRRTSAPAASEDGGGEASVSMLEAMEILSELWEQAWPQLDVSHGG